MKRRYVVASLAFFGFCVIYMLRVNLSVAIVAMTAEKPHQADNGTITIVRATSQIRLIRKCIIIFQYPDFTWDSRTQGVILGSFFYGYIVTQIPGGWLATKFGGKRVFLVRVHS